MRVLVDNASVKVTDKEPSTCQFLASCLVPNALPTQPHRKKIQKTNHFCIRVIAFCNFLSFSRSLEGAFQAPTVRVTMFLLASVVSRKSVIMVAHSATATSETMTESAGWSAILERRRHLYTPRRLAPVAVYWCTFFTTRKQPWLLSRQAHFCTLHFSISILAAAPRCLYIFFFAVSV